MNLLTWNVNGLRSLKDLPTIVVSLEADVLCFQETKLSRNQVDDKLAFLPDFSSYFNFPRNMAGYSGVVSYCRDSVRPFDAEIGLIWEEKGEGKDSSHAPWTPPFPPADLNHLEREGRTVVTNHCMRAFGKTINLFVFNVYCPCSHPERPERVIFKLKFYKLLEAKVRDVLSLSKDNHVVIAGDINTAHQRIDHCDPEERFELSPGREWLTDMFRPTDGDISRYFVDAFRHLHPTEAEAFTCWNTSRGARQLNYGTRIDYILIDSGLIPLLDECTILSHVTGSDHCPVLMKLKDVEQVMSPKVPSICSQLWPELGAGKKQSNLSRFLVKSRSRDEDEGIKESESEENTSNKRTRVKLKLEVKPKQKSMKEFLLSSRDNQVHEERRDTTLLQPLSEGKGRLEARDEDQSNERRMEKKVKATDIESREDATGCSPSPATQWKNLLKGPPKAPLCSGHSLPTVLKKVTKRGANHGKQFYACSCPVGKPSDPGASCNFFKWFKS